ncbi:MAG: SPOR domain-containing protein [Pseudomonadota bacterium]|nr:SPOR domain-containing protein [Pseudomonadota bacterium]
MDSGGRYFDGLNRLLSTLIVSSALLTGLVFNSPAQAALLEEDNLLLLDFVLERQILASSVTAYALGDTAVVSLAEAGAAFEFPIIVDPVAGTANGSFIRPERTFVLNLNEKFVEIEGKRKKLLLNDAFTHKDAIFVTVEALSRWFPVDLSLKISALKIEVMPRERLPLQERQARRRGAQQGYSVGPATLPLIDSPYKLLGPHAADIGLGYSIRRPESTGKTTTGLNYSALVSGDLTYMDSHIYLSGSDQDALSQARFSLSRDNLGMPLGLRYVEVGDIVPAIVPGVSYSGVERGVLIQGGGSTVGRDDLIGSDIFNLRGDALEGWDVELFQNGMRVGFQTIGANGRYNFTNIEPFAGENKFELAFYGPAGERRTETITRYSGLTPDLPGSVRYQLSASQKGEQIYDGQDTSYPGMSDRGSLRLAGSMEIRVLPKLSLRGAWNNLVVDGRRLNYTSLGASAGWRDITFGATATYAPLTGTRWDGSIALPAQKKLWGFDARFSHTQYAQTVLVDDPLVQDKYELQLRSRTGLTLSGPIGKTSTVFSLFHNQEPARSSNQASAGFTARTGRVTYGNTLNYFQFGRDSSDVRLPDVLDGSLFFSTSAQPLTLRGGLSYTLQPNAEARQYFLDSNLTIANDMSVNFGLIYTPLSNVTRYTSGLNWQFPQVTLSPRVNYDSNGEYSGFIYAAFSLAPRPDRAGIMVSGSSLATSGTVAARVFLDNDGSKTFSAEDEPLPNVSIRAIQAYRSAKTDDKGVAYLTNMDSVRPTDVVLATETLPSTQMISAHAGNSVRPRPTAIKVIDFPVIPTGVIDGHVYKMQFNRRAPLAGAMVELRNSAGAVVAFKISSQDGLFVFEDVPYDSYSLDLAGQLRASANQPKVILARERSEYSNVEIVIPETPATLAETSVIAQPVVTLPPAPALTVAKTQADPSPAPAAVDKPSDGRLVQIAAFADIEGARAYRQKLLSMPLLIDAQIDIVTVDLGRHGLFHRVVAKPGKSGADTMCSALKTQGIECITIAP